MSFEQSRMVLGFHNENFRGPGIVAKNLTTGLNRLNYPWISAATGATNNQSMFERSDVYTVFGVLQALSLPHNIKIDLLGPNTFVMPREAQGLIAQSKALVVPSQWCKDKYLFHDEDIIGNRPIYVWPVGIDTDLFLPSESKSIPKSVDELKILLYYKNRPQEDLEKAIKILVNNGINENNIVLLKYGSFSQESLIAACNKCHAAVLLAHTESQGLANLEILAMGVPMLVFDQKHWVYLEDSTVSWTDATSAPYFDESCGVKSDLNVSNADMFLSNVLDQKYNPRKYILDNFTLEYRAKQYVEIILESSKFD